MNIIGSFKLMEKENIESKQESFLQKKRIKKDSNEKEVHLCDNYGSNENIIETKSFKKVEEFEKYLSTLKHPYTIINEVYYDLNTVCNRYFFFNSEELKNIYQGEDNSEVYEYYEKYYYLYNNSTDHVFVNYPVTLDKILLAPDFYLGLTHNNYPKFYHGNDANMPYLRQFFFPQNYKLFHLYMRRWSGTTLYLMKQMERVHEGFIYLDLKKLNNIIEMNQKNLTELFKQIKKYLFYSLFNIQQIFPEKKESFGIIEKYYYYILHKIGTNISINRINDFVIALLNSYIDIYKRFIHPSLLLEKEEKFKQFIIIIDHYNYEITYDYINKILKDNNDFLKFIIKHSLSGRKEINEFFQNIDDNSYLRNLEFNTLIKGIEVIKGKTIIGYYEQMYPLNSQNFEDKDLKILKLYENELLNNFGLINQIYFFKFMDYMKDKEQDKKNQKIFSKFIKIISNDIELNIRKYYDNSLEDEYFFISKYFSINFSKKDQEDKHKIALVKTNLPLDYFIIKFAEDSKEILEIIPAFSLVKSILEKKSKNFPLILFQSKYYEETRNKGEKGNILQKAIEEKLRNEPSTLLNPSEENLIFELEYFIPKKTNLKLGKKDPVLDYYNAITKNTGHKQDILSYLSEDEKANMEKLSKIIKEKKNFYKNIILIQNNEYGKNYDLGIIKFIDNNHFIFIIYQITISRETKKFFGVNSCFKQDIRYIIDKFEHYLEGYTSKGIFLMYVLDKDEKNDSNDMPIQKEDKTEKKKSKSLSKENIKEKDNLIIEVIQYKNGLDASLKENVFLLYFGRKYLKFLTKEGQIIKEMVFVDDKIKFITSDKNHYFSDEYVQKIFDKIIDIFDIKVGKFYIDNYDYDDMIGNFMILTKISDKLVTIVIIIDGKKLHCLEADGENIKDIGDGMNYNSKISYIFEILNYDQINRISLFSDINIK